MPLHDSMPSFMNFRRVFDLLEFKNQSSQCFTGNQRCPSVWNSFPFLAWDLRMHPRTQIWFFNQFICTGACACSSNLNCAHKMPRKPNWYIKMSKRTPKNLYHNMLMPHHDSMPSFMNFRRVLDLLEFKNQASQCFASNQRCPGV